MSQQGARPGHEDDWWRDLYAEGQPDTGPAAAPDSVDDRFDSAARALVPSGDSTGEAPAGIRTGTRPADAADGDAARADAPDSAERDDAAPGTDASDRPGPGGDAADRDAPFGELPDRGAPDAGPPFGDLWFGGAPDRDAADRAEPGGGAAERDVPFGDPSDAGPPFADASDRAGQGGGAVDRDAPFGQAPGGGVPDERPPFGDVRFGGAPDETGPGGGPVDRESPFGQVTGRGTPGPPFEDVRFGEAPERAGAAGDTADRGAPEVPDRGAPGEGPPPGDVRFGEATGPAGPETGAEHRNPPPFRNPLFGEVAGRDEPVPPEAPPEQWPQSPTAWPPAQRRGTAGQPPRSGPGHRPAPGANRPHHDEWWLDPPPGDPDERQLGPHAPAPPPPVPPAESEAVPPPRSAPPSRAPWEASTGSSRPGSGVSSASERSPGSEPGPGSDRPPRPEPGPGAAPASGGPGTPGQGSPRPPAVVAFVGDGPPTYEPEPSTLPPADPAGLDDLVPDTVLDGARYGSFTLRAASLRGDSPRYRGEPRRDALLTARFGEGEQALVLVAVATGARAAAGAHRAAAALCQGIGSAVGRSHARLAADIRAGRRGALKSGLQRLTDRSYGELRADATAAGLDPAEYTADLRCLLLPADPECRTRVFFGVGKGGLLRLRDGRWQDIEPVVADEAAVTGEPVVGYGAPPPAPVSGTETRREGDGADSVDERFDRLTVELGIVGPDSRQPPPGEPFRFRASVARPGDVLLLCSGGLAEPLRGEPALAELLAQRWAVSAPPGLAAFLADVQLRAKGYADDRTAAAVWEA